MTKRKQTSKTEAEAREVATAESVAQMDRDEMIAVAASYRAEQRAFEPGHELEDWVQAEKQIDASLHAH